MYGELGQIAVASVPRSVPYATVPPKVKGHVLVLGDGDLSFSYAFALKLCVPTPRASHNSGRHTNSLVLSW
jgi:hypothetical protein